MNGVCKNRKSIFGILMLVVCLSFSVISQAERERNCVITSAGVRAELQVIRQDLLLAVTLDEYRKAIERRYDKVETLLDGSIQCSKAEKDHREQWLPLKKVLGTLRSNARKLAFTEFHDWMRVRERELALLEPVAEKPKPLQAQKPLTPDQPEIRLQERAQ